MLLSHAFRWGRMRQCSRPNDSTAFFGCGEAACEGARRTAFQGVHFTQYSPAPLLRDWISDLVPQGAYRKRGYDTGPPVTGLGALEPGLFAQGS